MEKYKAVLRIPTDTYAYMEISVEGTPEEIVAIYKKFKNTWNKKDSAIAKAIGRGAEIIEMQLSEKTLLETKKANKII